MDEGLLRIPPAFMTALRNCWSIPEIERTAKGNIFIKGLSRLDLLRAFFNSSGVTVGRSLASLPLVEVENFIQGLEVRENYLRSLLGSMGGKFDLCIEKTIRNLWFVDRFFGRIINLDLGGGLFLNPIRRDKVYGVGATELVVALLKIGLPPTHEAFKLLRFCSLGKQISEANEE